MKKILLPLLTIFCSTAIAQTNHNIGTVGTTFSPDNITIDVGDTVTWTNNGGTHNVNGTTVTFGSNPESFTNGSASTGWTFKHVFTMAGTYDYRCDPHAAIGMAGKVIVRGSMNTEIVADENIKVYPNPAADKVTISGLSETNRTIQLFSADGKLVLSKNVSGLLYELNLDSISVGIYQLKVIENGSIVHQERISKI